MDNTESLKGQANWDNMAEWYEKTAEMATMQGLIQCAVQSRMTDKDRVIDIACGPGKHSLMLASNFLKKGGVLVSCDFSKEMVKKLEHNYIGTDADYMHVEGNKFVSELEKDFTELDETKTKLKYTCDLEAVVESQKPFRKLAYGCQANNEMMPFADETFGAYIASLSLMLVNNSKNQIKEAYRILKNNSVATFTVWGRREQCMMFTVMDQVFEKHVPEDKWKQYLAGPNVYDNFAQYDDKGDQVKKDLEEVGFKGIKIWESSQNIMFKTGEIFMKSMHGMWMNKLKIFGIEDEELQKKLHQECTELYDNLSGANTSNMCTFGVAVIVAFKED